MHAIAITGATGFIGRHLLRELLERHDLAIRALAHDADEATLPRAARLTWIRGDLGDISSVRELLLPGCELVNLAFPGNWSREQHLAAAANLAKLAGDAGVRKVLHCSTAVVAGRTPGRHVTEATPPLPATEYEKTKLAIEEAWQAHCGAGTGLVILRPTAVFGPGGRNLLKLGGDLRGGARLTNYLRSSLFGHRRMNLVHVANVTAAIAFLLDRASPGARDVYIVSDDEAPANNFRDVERFLMRAWGIADYAVPPLPVPGLFLSVLLKLAGRSALDPARIYDSSKLVRAGLRKPCQLEAALQEFAAWYASPRTAPSDGAA